MLPLDIGGPGQFDQLTDAELDEYLKTRASMIIEGKAE